MLREEVAPVVEELLARLELFVRIVELRSLRNALVGVRHGDNDGRGFFRFGV